jgi:hypothetical protein
MPTPARNALAVSCERFKHAGAVLALRLDLKLPAITRIALHELAAKKNRH